ncbi:MAG TPA: twin-arginine translocase subunit TatC, partial [Blastococcus sp.]
MSEGGRPRSRRRREPRDDAATMSLVAHLTELRNRVAKALVALLIATAISFWWYEHGLGDFIRAPYCGLEPELRYGDADTGCGLLITDVFGGVFIRLKVAFLAGAVLSAPFWLYQLWAFITPGLKRHEKRYGIGFVAVSTLLFALGAFLAYVSLAKGLELLLT